jgi:hypothetical protein
MDLKTNSRLKKRLCNEDGKFVTIPAGKSGPRLNLSIDVMPLEDMYQAGNCMHVSVPPSDQKAEGLSMIQLHYYIRLRALCYL